VAAIAYAYRGGPVTTHRSRAQWRILRRLRRSRLIPELVVAEWRL